MRKDHVLDIALSGMTSSEFRDDFLCSEIVYCTVVKLGHDIFAVVLKHLEYLSNPLPLICTFKSV